jgi:hypothetical protein
MAAGVREARNMTLVGHDDLAGTGDCMHVNVVGGHAFVGHQGYSPVGTSIVDVADPEHPRLVAQIPRPPGTHTHKVQVVGDLMLVNHERNRFEPSPPRSWSAGMAIWDVARPERPTQIGFFETPGTGVHRMTWWEGPHAYVSGTDEGYRGRFLRVVDLSDPTRPREVGRWWFPGQHSAGGETPAWDGERDVMLHHALPAGDRLYCGWWDAGLVILDVGDPEKPVLVSHLDLGADSGNTHTAFPLPGRAVVVVTDEQLTRFIGTQRHVRVVDVADDTAPRVLARFPVPPGDHHGRGIRFGPHNVHEMRPGSLIDPDLVYLTYFAGGLRAYDLSDPAAPVEVAHIVPDPPPGREAIQLNDVTATPDGLIYVTDRHRGGLYIVRHDR